MPRRPASVTQADIARALRAAKAAGDDWCVEIQPGGVIRITREANKGQRAPSAEPTPPKREWRL